jgi:uncharacterized damage-inducible protein DinB
MKSYFSMLARYNLWATRKLYEHVDILSEDDYRGDCGLFFRSVHGTLNHLLVGGDLVWYPRFAHGASPQGVSLSDEVEQNRVALKARLLQSGERWCALIESFHVGRYQDQIEYTTMRGTRALLPFAATLAHVFNHGTHHRGQISAAITAQGHECPEIDLVYMLQQEQPADSNQ